ncbi:MAG: hypothetical protein Q8L49_13955 [Burkholderiaceae bacterium]|nr:hypothetical protein [Burkholderiaceae bacterium]
MNSQVMTVEAAPSLVRMAHVYALHAVGLALGPAGVVSIPLALVIIGFGTGMLGMAVLGVWAL